LFFLNFKKKNKYSCSLITTYNVYIIYAGPGADAAAPPAAPSAHNAAPHSQPSRGFSDWSASNSAFASVAVQPAPATTTTTPFHHYNLSQSYTLWTHYMLNKNALPYTSYPAAPRDDNPHPLHHTHIPPDKDSGTVPCLFFMSLLLLLLFLLILFRDKQHYNALLGSFIYPVLSQAQTKHVSLPFLSCSQT
jgi:hypothetical protein